MPRRYKSTKPYRPNTGEEKAVWRWHRKPNEFNTWCWYRQQEVGEPGCVCPVQLEREGYLRVRATDTCASYFRGRTIAPTDEAA